MKQTTTITFRASNKKLEEKINDYEKEGWRVISKERGSWWGKVGNSYNWRLVLEREEETKHSSPNSGEDNSENVVDQLIKLKELLDDNAITQEEYDLLKKRIMK